MGLLASRGGQKKQATDYQVQWETFGGTDDWQNGREMLRYMPAEWDEQSGVQLTWPHAGTDWRETLPEVTGCFLQIARAVAERELLLIVAPDTEAVRSALSAAGVRMENVRFCACPTDDTWARDHGGITLLGDRPLPVLDFRFNGWGGKFPADKDNRITRTLFQEGLLHGEREDHDDFVLEGGSIECDGKGTLLTTTRCLITSPGRNTQYFPEKGQRFQEKVEDFLKKVLHVRRVLWLEHGGIAGDDTDGHIDTLARFAPGDTIVYVQCPDPQNPNFRELQAMEQELQALRTADGSPYRLLPLPSPEIIRDEEGRILPATYANFLVINGAVLVPTYGQPASDAKACEVIGEAFPGREIIGIDCRPLIRQNGSLHCVTMQYPKGILL